MDLLVCLARHAGETVAKETLLAEVWRGAFVVEGVIPKTLSGLRAALGDDAAAPTFVLTVPRRGYRLVAPVRWLDETPREPTLPRTEPHPQADEGVATPNLLPEAARVEAPVASRPGSGDAPAPDRRLLGVLLGLAAAAALAWLLYAAAGRPAAGPVPAGPAVSESVARLLLEARHLWAQRGLDSVRRGADLMQRAVQEAPESAEAHAWLALSTITRASYLGGTAAACDQIDYWVTAGNSPAQIERQYADATGHAPVMPEWGLGFWQCKLRYWNQEQLLETAREFKRRNIPIDLIVIDFFHWPLMGDFRFDEEFWPDPKAMTDELDEMGIKLMVSVWPQIDLESENYDEMRAHNYLAHTTGGKDVGMWWPRDNQFTPTREISATNWVWASKSWARRENGRFSPIRSRTVASIRSTASR